MNVEEIVDRSERIRKWARLLVAAGLLTLPAPHAVANAGDSATGSGSTFSSAGETFSFAATGQGGGTRADGTMQYSNISISLTATVTCLQVEGNRAVVGGKVTASSSPQFVGYRLAFHVQDTATPGVGQDLFEEFLHKGQRLCRSFIGGFALTAGEITVVDAP